MKKILFILAIVIIFCARAPRAQQQNGTPNQIRVLTDANNYLLVSGLGQTLPINQPQVFSNTRLKTDANGYLLVVLTGGTITAPLEIDKNGIVVTSTDGIVIANNTAATAGVPVQQSPRLRFRSHVWNTTATAADNTNDWFIESVPTSGTVPLGVLKFGRSLNGGAATFPMTLSSDGRMDLTGPMVAASFSASGNGGVGGVFFGALTGTQINPNIADAKINLTNAAVNGGIGLDFSTNGLLLFRTLAQTGAGGIGFKTLSVSGTDPTIASGGCTSPAVTWANGTAAFKLTIGTSCTGVKTITLTLPAATNGWACDVTDNTTPASFRLTAQSTNTTAVIISNWAATTGLTIDFVAGEVLFVKCLGG